MRRFFIHVALIIGCVVFSFPFFWLLSTSFKGDKEIGVFPPRWIPQVPWYAVQSPFISGNAYETMSKPDALDAPTWARLRPPIERILWRQVETQGVVWMKQASGMADSDNFRPQMTRGLWEQVKEVVPETIWRNPDELPAFVERSVTPEMMEKAWNNVVRVLVVGRLQVRDVNNDAVKLGFRGRGAGVKAWQVKSGSAQLAPVTVEKQEGWQVNYDLRDASQFVLTCDFTAPVTPDKISALSLPIHCDETWHRLLLTVENGGKVYTAQRPVWMNIRTWQDVEWVFKEPPYRGARSIVLRPDPQAPTDVRGAYDYRVTLTFLKASKLRAAFDKYFYAYRETVRYVDFWLLLSNTLKVVFLNVLGHVLVCSLVAYGFARMQFYGREVLFGLVLATMMLPADVTRIPHFILMKYVGWYDTLKPLWVGAWFGSPFFVFLLRQFFLTIPKELEDAAKIDGCNHFGIYWRVMLPLVKPALATVAIFSFMGSWNDFSGPLIYLSSSDHYTMAYGLYQFRTEHTVEHSLLMAAATIMALPIIALFFFCQRYMIQGVTLTGLKG
ncbi:MAG: ABC transporter permease subunit [Abditibacteriales bacterium]|nr:ABC transporter permease subunit [Abditibacteriales bacterium]MDW8365094.1 ABC transporter permease subunit [Abditibacteriales bacterium]